MVLFFPLKGETILQQGIEQCFISHRYSTWGLQGAGNFILTPTEGHMNRESDSDSPARDCCLWPLSLTLLQGLNLLLNLPLQWHSPGPTGPSACRAGDPVPNNNTSHPFFLDVGTVAVPRPLSSPGTPLLSPRHLQSPLPSTSGGSGVI